jgi:steroid delta-isomerase-like uncharacterized protein
MVREIGPVCIPARRGDPERQKTPPVRYTPGAMATPSTALDRDALAESYLEAWNAHDPDAVAAFFAPAAVYDDRGAGAVASGRPAIRDHVEAVIVAFPDLRFELVRKAHGEDFSAAEWTCRMTHRGPLFGVAPTGRVLTSAGVDVATLDGDGKIARLVSYYDGAAIMRALGLLPGRGSRIERLLIRAASVLRRRRR